MIAMGVFLEEDTRTAGAISSLSSSSATVTAAAAATTTTTGVGMISMRVHVSRKRKIKTNNFAKRGEIRSSTAVKRVPTSDIPPSMVRMVVVAGWVSGVVGGRAGRSFVWVLVLVLVVFVAFVVVVVSGTISSSS